MSTIQSKLRFTFDISADEFQVIVKSLERYNVPESNKLALELRDARDLRYAEMVRRFQVFLNMRASGEPDGA